MINTLIGFDEENTGLALTSVGVLCLVIFLKGGEKICDYFQSFDNMFSFNIMTDLSRQVDNCHEKPTFSVFLFSFPLLRNITQIRRFYQKVFSCILFVQNLVLTELTAAAAPSAAKTNGQRAREQKECGTHSHCND